MQQAVIPAVHLKMLSLQLIQEEPPWCLDDEKKIEYRGEKLLSLKKNRGEDMKKKIYIALLCLGLAGMTDTVILLFYVNRNIGTLLPGVAGLGLVAYSCLKLWVYRDRPVISNGFVRKLVISGMLLAAVSFVLLEGVILYNGSSQEIKQTEYVVILGAAVRGERVSATLKARLDKGVEYLNAYPQCKAVVSGGQGAGEQISEAEAMKRYLVASGIAKDRIIMENRSTSTMENFKYTKQLLMVSRQEELPVITVVTSDFHMFRAKLLATRNGFTAYGISSSTPASVRVNNYIREYFGLVKSYIYDR